MAKAKKKPAPRKRASRASTSSKKRNEGSSPLLGSMMHWLLVLVAVLPFLIKTEVMDPVVTLRFVFFSGFLLLMIAYFFLINKKPPTLRLHSLSKLFIGLGLGLGVWHVLSLAMAINVPEGLYITLRYWLYFIAAIVVMIAVTYEEALLPKILKALVVILILQAIVGIFQFYELAFEELPPFQGPPYGLMGNRNLFASAQVLLLPFAAYVMMQDKGPWRWAAIAGLTLGVYSLILAQTRAAWLSMIAAFITAQVLVFITHKKMGDGFLKNWLKGSGIALLGAVAVVALAVISDSDLSKSLKARVVGTVAKGPAAGKAPLDAETASAIASGNERMIIWGQCLQMLKDNPIMGVGAGNWRLNIPTYGAKGLINDKGKRVRLRPHNVYLLIADELGIPGILLYLGIWVVMALIGLQLLFKLESVPQKLLVIFMLVGMASYAVDSLFSFPNERMEHNLYLMLMWGILLGLYTRIGSAATEKEVNLKPVAAGGAVAILAFAAFLGINQLDFQHQLLRAKAYGDKGDFITSVKEADKGKNSLVTLSPTASTIEQYAGKAYKGQKQYAKAIAAYQEALAHHPHSFQIHNDLGTVYSEMGDFPNAVTSYLKALDYASQLDPAIKNLAIAYFNMKEYQQAKDWLSKAEIGPNDKMLVDLKRQIDEALLKGN